MKIKERISNRIKECMKSGSSFERDTLKTVLGEIQSKEAISGEMSDENCEKVFKKFKQGVEETIKIVDNIRNDSEMYWLKEIAIYDEYITPSMSLLEIVEFLKSQEEAIKGANSDGQATGIAMGACKKEGFTVDGKDVAEAVKTMRSE